MSKNSRKSYKCLVNIEIDEEFNTLRENSSATFAQFILDEINPVNSQQICGWVSQNSDVNWCGARLVPLHADDLKLYGISNTNAATDEC